MRGAGAPHRRLATAIADLKASRELAWIVPGDYGSWEKRLSVLFGVITWNFKAVVMVSGLVVDWILNDVVWTVCNVHHTHIKKMFSPNSDECRE